MTTYQNALVIHAFCLNLIQVKTKQASVSGNAISFPNLPANTVISRPRKYFNTIHLPDSESPDFKYYCKQSRYCKRSCILTVTSLIQSHFPSEFLNNSDCNLWTKMYIIKKILKARQGKTFLFLESEVHLFVNPYASLNNT